MNANSIQPSTPPTNNPQLPITPTQPSISPPAPASPPQKFPWLTKILPLFLLSLTTTGYFAYKLYGNPLQSQQTAEPPTQTQNNSNSTTPPTNHQITAEETININSLQDFINQKCTKTDNQFSFTETIDSIPLTLNIDALSLEKNHASSYIYCVSSDIERMKSGALILGSKQQYFIYDEYSQIPGGGGPPSTGEYGIPMYSNGPLTLYVYSSGPHGGPFLATNIEIHIRAIKTFNTQSQPIHFSTDRILFSASDPTLLEALKPFTQTYQPATIQADGKTYQIAVLDDHLWIDPLPSEELMSKLDQQFPNHSYYYMTDAASLIGQLQTTDDFELEKVIKNIYPTTQLFLNDPTVQFLIDQMDSVKAK